MVKDAEQHAEEDRNKRDEVQSRNSAENGAYSAEKLLQDNADKIDEDLKKEVEEKIAAVRTALESQDVAGINSASQELQESVQKVGQAVYSQPGGPEDAPPPPDDGEPPEGTVEGEFREV